MHPRRDAIGRRPDFPITNDGAVECRLLGPAAVVDRGSDAARWRLILYPAPDFGFVEALQDYFQYRRCQRGGHRRAYHRFVLARFHRRTPIRLTPRPGRLRAAGIGEADTIGKATPRR